MSILARLLSALIHVYRTAISPLFPNACRYQPTCSAFALEALARHGAFKGLWLAGSRILRCHPWGGRGYDPVPGTLSNRTSCGDARGLNDH